MKQPQRTQPSRTARSGPNALSLTSPQSAPCDVPQVLERSTRSLADVKKCTGDVTGPGVLVKLYLVGDLWIVGSPHTKKWTPSKVEDMRTANATAKANDRTKASHPAKSRPSSAHEAKAQLNSDEVVTQKKRRSRGRGEGKATGQQVHKDQDESDDMSDETEGEEDAGEEDVGDEIAGKEDAWKQNTGEGDAGKGDAAEENEEEEGDVEEEDVEEEDAGGEDVAEEDGGEDNDAEEQAARKQDAGGNSEENSSDPEKEGDLEDGPERNSVVIEENGHDAEEEEEDGHNKVSKDTGTKAADKRVDEDYEGEEGYAETNGKEGELEAKGQPEAEREGERESGEKTSEETEPSSEAGGKDRAVHDGEEEEERCTNAAKETNTVEEGSESTEENKKRASADSISEEHPNKRHKSGRDRNGVGTTTVDSLDRTIGLNAQLRPQTPPAKSTTPSTPSTIEVVRQTSVVPGLEDTECAVWDAALRDSIVNSLPLEQQARMIHAALSLGSKAGIDALRHFVENARKEGKRRRENLQSGFQPDVPHFGVEVWHATGTMISRDRSLAHFSDLYRRIDILDNKVVTFSIAKRVQLAALAEYRKSLLQEGAGRNQAKDINLHLFHTVYPDHAIVRDPDAKGTSSAARRDWNRLCNRLREGRMWFEVRHLFGGVGAFLALPPQCVSDRHLYRMPAATFSSWLRLLEVAWRALNTHARHTLNDLVRMSLVGQPLPDGLLALETLENGPGTAPASLSDILTGWSLFERKSQDDEGESSPMTHCEKDGNRAAIGPPSTTASSTNTLGKIDPGSCSREVSDVDDGLLNDLEFDDGLSQEI